MDKPTSMRRKGVIVGAATVAVCRLLALKRPSRTLPLAPRCALNVVLRPLLLCKEPPIVCLLAHEALANVGALGGSPGAATASQRRRLC